MEENGGDPQVEARRRFLATCGKFALVTPPVVSLMLSQADKSFASVSSGGGGYDGHNNDGGGNPWGDGKPGKPDKPGKPGGDNHPPHH